MTELKYFAGYALTADASAWFAVGIGALLLLTGAAYFVTLLIVAVRKKRNGDYELKNYDFNNEGDGENSNSVGEDKSEEGN